MLNPDGPCPATRPVIIELFGAPGAGKTTFAHAFAARLRASGCTVQLILSQRPAEREQSEKESAADVHVNQALLAIGRLTRPFAEVLRMASHPVALSHEIGTALKLVNILPPDSALWRLRLVQYISRLSRNWARASSGSDVVVFDQAFIQAVCSLALLSGTDDERLISRALDQIPQSDLSVRLEAPTAVLDARLRDRLHLVGDMERRLELDLATSLRTADIVICIEDILRRKGRHPAIATSLDQPSLDEAVGRLEQQITAQIRQPTVGGLRPSLSVGSSRKMHRESSLRGI
jgi:RecA/RadA recombinase